MLRAQELGHLRISAITCSHGNVPLQHVIGNVCAILAAFGGPAASSIPVFIGADAPLCSRSTSAAEWHGADGLGNTQFGASAPRASIVTGEHGAAALLRLARLHAGGSRGLSVLTLGPLTNLSLALRLSGGELGGLLSRLVVMGGAYTGYGNVSPGAEFNVLEDPEAAAAVFATKWGCGLDLVTWEATRAHGVPPSCMRRWLHTENPRAKFLTAVSAHLVDVTERFSPETFASMGFFIPDPLAAAVAAAPEIVKQSVTLGVVVETQGKWGRGMTILDWGGRHKDEAPPCVRIIQVVEQSALEAMLVESVG